MNFQMCYSHGCYWKTVAEPPLPLTTLALLVLAAVIHSSAHVALKRAADKLAFTWWELLAIVIVYSPSLLRRAGIGRRACGSS